MINLGLLQLSVFTDMSRVFDLHACGSHSIKYQVSPPWPKETKITMAKKKISPELELRQK